MLLRLRLLLLPLVLLSSCVLPPWPLGEPSPGFENRDDDDAADDDDDDDDDAADDDDDDDDDAADDDDDDDAADDDDDTFNPNDHDGDGWEDEEDCDDSDATINPGADEVHCDGIDNDCDAVELCDVCGGATLAVDADLTPGDFGHSGELTTDSQIDGTYFFDVYRLTTLGTGWIDVSLSATAFRPYLELRAENCAIIAYDSPNFSDLSWILSGTQSGDVYYVVASSAYAMQVGPYSMTFSLSGF